MNIIRSPLPEFLVMVKPNGSRALMTFADLLETANPNFRNAWNSCGNARVKHGTHSIATTWNQEEGGAIWPSEFMFSTRDYLRVVFDAVGNDFDSQLEITPAISRLFFSSIIM
jgi:hypothetical protein